MSKNMEKDIVRAEEYRGMRERILRIYVLVNFTKKR